MEIQILKDQGNFSDCLKILRSEVGKLSKEEGYERAELGDLYLQMCVMSKLNGEEAAAKDFISEAKQLLNEFIFSASMILKIYNDFGKTGEVMRLSENFRDKYKDYETTEPHEVFYIKKINQILES
ncbi:MAG: hypothetical protein AAFX62_02820 [Pseudomonadota bacterium]